MHRVELKLAEWHRLYKELERARTRLRAGKTQPRDASAQVQMQQEVDRLERESDQALDVVYKVIEHLLPPDARKKLARE